MSTSWKQLNFLMKKNQIDKRLYVYFYEHRHIEQKMSNPNDELFYFDEVELFAKNFLPSHQFVKVLYNILTNIFFPKVRFS